MSSRHAKTARGARVLKRRGPQEVELKKNVMFVHGPKTSQIVKDLITDLGRLKADAVRYKRKNDIRPFEDATSLEFFSSKCDAGVFVFTSHQKKRPHNLVFGRMFDHNVLDMVEVGVENVRLLNSFDAKYSPVRDTKPCFIFQGDGFERDPVLRTLSQMLLDMFRGVVVHHLDLGALTHVIVVTAVEGHVLFRSHTVALKKSTSQLPRVELNEAGPCFDMVVRRSRQADAHVMRQATRLSAVEKPRKTKNVEYTAVGDRMGRVHMNTQDLDKLTTRKVKGLKRRHDEGEHSVDNDGDAAGANVEKDSNDTADLSPEAPKSKRTKRR